MDQFEDTDIDTDAISIRWITYPGGIIRPFISQQEIPAIHRSKGDSQRANGMKTGHHTGHPPLSAQQYPTRLLRLISQFGAKRKIYRDSRSTRRILPMRRILRTLIRILMVSIRNTSLVGRINGTYRCNLFSIVLAAQIMERSQRQGSSHCEFGYSAVL
jgi:hypothetical protein